MELKTSTIFRWAFGSWVVSGPVVWELGAERKYHQTRILYPSKLSFKMKKKKIKTRYS